ncbi:MAG: GreA/GreB family elongation factor [Winogradskyella sp.]|jgi:regulator of nucleoside diphosphate kinase|uniref:GreA/GreB family elongation factor n=1 Tax=Xanthomarina gelatinilytica TaxID=1137281 RepID=UPI001DE13275|nr:GreA/GreB family elongation factor [Winogradskyella sp.]MDX1317930.1 GreA/GreB family elongation factor [Xanthomarina gelatinilytica]
MKYGSLILEKKEFVTLKRLLNLSGNYKDASRKNSVLRLQNELESAIVSNEDEMPDDVIRFNSEVTIVSSDGWENSFQLVSPTESNFSHKKLSVLTPMGLAVMGYAKGDVIDWEFPGGAKSLKVTEVKQVKTKSNQIQL